MNINEVRLCGRLTKNPELKTTKSGKYALNFALAVNRSYGENQTVSFINCACYDKVATNISKYCVKGSELYCEGYINTSSYDDQQTGKRVFTTNIVVSSIQFGARTNVGNSSYQQFENQVNSDEQFNNYNSFDTGTSVDISSDDLPF